MEKDFISTGEEKKWFERIAELADRFAKNAAERDENGEFPLEELNALIDSGYTALSVPAEFGGGDLPLHQLVLLQERLAQGNAALSLSIGWHMGIMMDLSLRREWDEAVFSDLCKKVVDGKIINRAQTEPQTGSPTRGGKPATTAVKTEDGFVLTGRKTFTTLSTGADYLIVSAAIAGTDDVGGFLVPRDIEGVRVEPTWQTMGMRATRSDDFILDHVEVPSSAHVETVERPPKSDRLPPAWLLHIPATYMGIALKARADTIGFAKNYQPNSLDTPISEVAHVQEKIGRIDLKIRQARAYMYYIAGLWDNVPEKRLALGADLAAVKGAVMEAALEAVDLGMRIVGGQSIFKSLPFERYYRDLRAGLHNPPSDDAVIRILAKNALGD